MKSFKKFIFGLFLLVLHYISLLIIEAVGYKDISDEDSTCFLEEKENKSWINYKWYFIPELLRGYYQSSFCIIPTFCYVFLGNRHGKMTDVS